MIDFSITINVPTVAMFVVLMWYVYKCRTDIVLYGAVTDAGEDDGDEDIERKLQNDPDAWKRL